MPKTRLILVVPAIRYFPRVWGYQAAWEPLMKRICAEMSCSGDDGSKQWVTKWYFIDHDVHTFSFGSAWRRSREVHARIEQRLKSETGGCDDIILVGHSMGGVLARQAYLLALGIGEHQEPSIWAPLVSRIVLFATINNGVDLSKAGLVGLLARVAKLTGFLRWSIFRHVLKGSAFIANLRLEWIRNVSPRTRAGEKPTVVQVIGSKDTMVSRNESLDEALGASHVLIPEANHVNLYRRGHEDERYVLLRAAFLEPTAPKAIPIRSPGQDVVVFLLHGIRASNSDWVAQLASRIRDRRPEVDVVTSSYGFFSIFNFTLPWLRKKNISWFLDQYGYKVECKPGARFHFVGHSNGTYILGQSLNQVPAMRFGRVVLMGSPLPRSYDWREHLDADAPDDPNAVPQVEEIQNHRSSGDFVVALVAQGLRGLGPPWSDIGAAGFSGFDASHPRLREVYYHSGGHSAPMKTGASLDRIADYICSGVTSKPESCSSEVELPWWSGFTMRLMPYAFRVTVWPLLAVDLILLWSWVLAPALNSEFDFSKTSGLLAAHLVAYFLAKTV